MAGIDSDYWLDFAKDGVSKSIENREKAAEKLDTFLFWIWSIYTSIFALASLLNFISSNIWQLVLVTQPILIIMLSRYFCANVSIPSTNNTGTSADPSDIPDIIKCYKNIVTEKERKLQTAKIFTFISMASLILAIAGYNYCDPDKALKQDIQTMKLKKELNSLEFVKVQQKINDSIKSLNEYYDYQIQNILKQKKLECIESGDIKRLESLKLFESGI